MVRCRVLNGPIAMMGLSSLAALLLICRFIGFPPLASSISHLGLADFSSSANDPFTDLSEAFRKWDEIVGCDRFREKHKAWKPNASVVQSENSGDCRGLGQSSYVRVLVKEWSWIPDNLDQLYYCRCGLSCLWTKSPILADKPDALLFENSSPPPMREKGEPLRVYLDLEAPRKRSGTEDIFVGYHVKDDVQVTYAGAQFHNARNYHVSPQKRNDTLVYWSSSRCLPHRDKLASSFLKRVPHHSFGRCLNNVGGTDMALTFYPECAATSGGGMNRWWDHLHCAMSHYKFVLAVENTATESYVTEKLFYALDAGAVPVYFGAPDVTNFVPPDSIIDGSKFRIPCLAALWRARQLWPGPGH
ncbi:fucosyltransferase 13 isoform X2 [Wolffia australiana]